jgi:hypothetical protein
MAGSQDKPPQTGSILKRRAVYYRKEAMQRSLELRDAKDRSIPMNDVAVRETMAIMRPLKVEERKT